MAIFIPYRLQATVQLHSHIIFDKDQFFAFIIRVDLILNRLILLSLESDCDKEIYSKFCTIFLLHFEKVNFNLYRKSYSTNVINVFRGVK